MSLKLVFTGDIFPGNLHYTVGYGVASTFRSGEKQEWMGSLREIFGEADLVVGNLEAPVLDDGIDVNELCFAGSGQFVEFLKRAGVNLVSVANNHILEHGKKGFDSTLNILDANGIPYVGAAGISTGNIYIYRKGPISIGFAAFNAIHDINNPNLYAEYSVSNVLSAISEMSKSDVMYRCILIHWGNEYVHLPSYDQVIDARRFIDSGAHIVIGNHPHVIQPVEEYHGGVIAYSLGNFLFDMAWSKQVKEAITLRIILTDRGALEYSIHPVLIGDEYIPQAKKGDRDMDPFRQSMKMFTQYLGFSEDMYRSKYNRLVRWNTIRERIRMKYFLASNIFRLSKKARMSIIDRAMRRLFSSPYRKSMT